MPAQCPGNCAIEQNRTRLMMLMRRINGHGGAGSTWSFRADGYGICGAEESRQGGG
jgi:hypothetical protein